MNVYLHHQYSSALQGVVTISDLFRWTFDLSFWLSVLLVCVSGSGEEPTPVIANNVTGVLGEDLYLSCEYVGEGQIQKAEWKRKINSQSKFKRLAGFSNGRAFGRDDFSEPDSLTNLTVRMRVSSMEAEGEYICEFEEEEENLFVSVFLTVLGKLISAVRKKIPNNKLYKIHLLKLPPDLTYC